jgi:hypothetical protein
MVAMRRGAGGSRGGGGGGRGGDGLFHAMCALFSGSSQAQQHLSDQIFLLTKFFVVQQEGEAVVVEGEAVGEAEAVVGEAVGEAVEAEDEAEGEVVVVEEAFRKAKG